MSSRRILLSGSSGLLGTHIAAALRAAGDRVVPLVRRRDLPDSIFWDPQHGELDPALVSGFDAVIHLAGEPVAGLWTKTKKQRILQSRVQGTELLVRALAAAAQPPQTLLCASGINVYGNRGDEILDEAASAGQSFLAEVCIAWERAAMALAPVSRVACMRIGVVLAEDGGTLAAMLPVFRLGLGGAAAGGTNYLSWIGIDDLVAAVLYLLATELHGPVNLVAPHPVTGAQFAKALGGAVHRPAILPVPAWLMRATLGQFAEETILTSLHVLPARLQASGFTFRQPELAEALAALGL